MSDLQCPARIVFVCIDPEAPLAAYAEVVQLLQGDRLSGAWTAPENRELAEEILAPLGLDVRTDDQLGADANRWRISTAVGEIADLTRGEGTVVLAPIQVIGQAVLSCPNITPDLESDPLRPGMRVEVSIDSEGWWCRAWGLA